MTMQELRMMPGRLSLARRAVLTAALVAAMECMRVLLLDISQALDAQRLLPLVPVSLLVAFAHDAVALSEWFIIGVAAYAATTYTGRKREGIGIGLVIGFLAGCVIAAVKLALAPLVPATLKSTTFLSDLREGAIGHLALTVGVFCAVAAISGAIGAYRALR